MQLEKKLCIEKTYILSSETTTTIYLINQSANLSAAQHEFIVLKGQTTTFAFHKVV